MERIPRPPSMRFSSRSWTRYVPSPRPLHMVSSAMGGFALSYCAPQSLATKLAAFASGTCVLAGQLLLSNFVETSAFVEVGSQSMSWHAAASAADDHWFHIGRREHIVWRALKRAMLVINSRLCSYKSTWSAFACGMLIGFAMIC